MIAPAAMLVVGTALAVRRGERKLRASGFGANAQEVALWSMAVRRPGFAAPDLPEGRLGSVYDSATFRPGAISEMPAIRVTSV
jgi:hypothetical protein